VKQGVEFALRGDIQCAVASSSTTKPVNKRGVCELKQQALAREKPTAAAYPARGMRCQSWFFDVRDRIAPPRSGQQTSSSTLEVGITVETPRILWVAELFAADCRG